MESPGLAAVGADLVSALPGVCEFAADLLDEFLELLAGEVNQQGVAAGCCEAHHPIGDANGLKRLAVEVNVGVAFGADVHWCVEQNTRESFPPPF